MPIIGKENYPNRPLNLRKAQFDKLSKLCKKENLKKVEMFDKLLDAYESQERD